ncbi:transposase, partial [Salmonella enterica subsp. enterica serovar Typhimurium]|uniref:RNA-guided endonuclease InsQ/TnpB family protein n=1 Tax=Salmonella enterica TaxID=28901 RepID=UPI000CA66C12
QSWYELRTMFEYKSEWYGKTFVKVDPRYTSQDCSNCHERTGPRNDLSVRHWICSSCGLQHDRDINAGRNILDRGLQLVG